MSPTLQKRSSIHRARYWLALPAVLAAGCGGDSERADPGRIAVDSKPLARGAYAKPLGAAVESSHARKDAAYRRALITRFTSVTTENGLKWGVLRPERSRFAFKDADAVVAFARRTGKRVRGHPLVWDEQLPAWVEEGNWTRTELRRVLRDHIRRVVGRYRGRVAEWDVVNEPLADGGGWEENVWYRTLGPGYVAFAFRVARRADPGARLFLNEIGAELPSAKSNALIRLARYLKRRGAPIDGVGFQNHAKEDAIPDAARLRHLFRSLRRLGLDAAITEMDVDASEDEQLRAYRDAARACAGAPNCTGLTVWGVTDRWSWLGGDTAPLPFDDDGEPKPAFEALVRPLRR